MWRIIRFHAAEARALAAFREHDRAAEGEAIADVLSHRRDRAPGRRRRETLAGHAQRLYPIHEISFSILGR